MSRARDLIDRFGREEDSFLRTEFVAPVAPGSRVRVRICGIVCELAVRGAADGISVLRPISHREAEVVRPAGLAEARRYLSLFPRARLVAAARYGHTWMGLPAAAPPKGVKVEGIVPIATGRDLRLFETAVVRFDGSLFLLESTERPAMAAFLRGELERGASVGDLRKPGLTDPERRAYAAQVEIRREASKSVEDRRLGRALRFAGADLVRWEERNGVLSVTYRVDGREITSLVAKDDLSVVGAGICLDERDGEFDLTSLVGVMREHGDRE